mgnify:CR=1 FL=1
MLHASHADIEDLQLEGLPAGSGVAAQLYRLGEGQLIPGVGVGEGGLLQTIRGVLALVAIQVKGVGVGLVLLGDALHPIQRVGIRPAGGAARPFAQEDGILAEIAVDTPVRMANSFTLTSARASSVANFTLSILISSLPLISARYIYKIA